MSWYVYKPDGSKACGPVGIEFARRAASYWGTEPKKLELPDQMKDQKNMELSLKKVQPKTISVSRKDLNANRIKKENELLEKVGIVPTDPIYAVGTPINSIGEKNRLGKRIEYENLPTAEALLDVASVIEQEERKDLMVQASDLRMKLDGTITDKNGSFEYPIELDAFKGLLARLRYFPSMGNGLLLNSSDSRARYFNAVIKERRFHFVDEKRGPLLINLGTRINRQQRRIYRAVSPTYNGEMDASKVLKAQYQALKYSSAKIDCTYNPETTIVTSDFIWNENHDGGLGAGSVFRVGIRAKTGDKGNHGYFIDAIAWRNLCLNLLVIALEKSHFFYARHVGDSQRIQSGVREGLDAAQEAFKPFLENWNYVQDKHISKFKIWGKRFETVEAALAYGTKKKKITKDIAEKVLFDSLINGLEKEPGNTGAHLINAITRAAHESLLDDIQRDLLERKAGQLLHVMVA